MLSNLRTFVLAPALLAAVAFTTQTAMAETATVNVPFNFIVAGKACPAGHYMIERDDARNSVGLAGYAHGFLWFTHPGDPSPNSRSIVLSFDKLGSDHILRSVQYGSQITSRLDKKYMHSNLESEQITAGQ